MYATAQLLEPDVMVGGSDCTCLSLSPNKSTSSINVNLGCLLLSSLSLMSRGSNAILCPFSPPVYDVSGPLLSLGCPGLGVGELTRPLSLSSLSAPKPVAPPLLRVKPEPEEAISLSALAFDKTPN